MKKCLAKLSHSNNRSKVIFFTFFIHVQQIKSYSLFQVKYEPEVPMDTGLPMTGLDRMVDVPLDDMLPVPLSSIKEEDVKIDVTSVPSELPIRVFSVSCLY